MQLRCEGRCPHLVNCCAAIVQNVRHGNGIRIALLVTSVDMEGTRKGFDCELVRAVSEAVTIPVIASGGMGKVEHLVDVVQQGYADAVAMADILHYGRATINQVRAAALAAQLHVRQLA